MLMSPRSLTMTALLLLARTGCTPGTIQGAPASVGTPGPCDGFAAWWSNDEVADAIGRYHLVGKVEREAGLAVAGEEIDRDAMSAAATKLQAAADDLGKSAPAPVNQPTPELATAAYSQAAAIAGTLAASGEADAAAVTALDAAVTDYEQEVAAQEARCA